MLIPIPPTEKYLSILENLVTKVPAVQYELDDLVVDEYLGQASNCNNSGLREQLELLLETRTFDEILASLNLPPNVEVKL